MVILHVKRDNESQFLYETDVEKTVDEVVKDITAIFNGRLKVTRICYEMEELQKHGTFLPLEMQGLTEEQVPKDLLIESMVQARWKRRKYFLNGISVALPTALKRLFQRDLDLLTYQYFAKDISIGIPRIIILLP